MNVRADLGGKRPPVHYRAETQRDLNSYPLPAASILVPADPPLKRSRFFQTLFDIGAVIFAALFICAVAVSLPVAVFLLLFCKF